MTKGASSFNLCILKELIIDLFFKREVAIYYEKVSYISSGTIWKV